MSGDTLDPCYKSDNDKQPPPAIAPISQEPYMPRKNVTDLITDQEKAFALGRLWEIANTSAEKTRGSFTSQIKALSMIGAMDGFIPNKTAVAAAAEVQENQNDQK